MPVPSAISDLSATPGLNSPAGSESPASIDDYLRTHAAFIRQVSDSNDSSNVKLTGNQTIAGTKTFSSPIAGSITGSAATAGNITGTVAIANGGTGATSAPAALAALGGGPQIAPISASVAGNALTITLNPTALAFRSTTLGSGSVNVRTVSAAISLTVSSGSTLGTTNGALARLAVLALDNAGTVELAVVNLVGGVNLNEEGLISTTAEGGAGAADSASTVYSTTARTNVPYRLLGFIESTQATAGTWATAPSLVHASDPLAKWLSGYGQTWQDVSGSRALATNYTNTTGRPIVVQYLLQGTAGTQATLTVGGQSIAVGGGINGAGNTSACSAVIPAGAIYNASNTAVTLSNWRELR